MIRIEDEQFKPLRENINFMIDKTIKDMMETGEIKETVTAKISILLSSRAVQVSPTETRMAFVPEFKFKVTMAKQIRQEVEGEVYEDQMEISQTPTAIWNTGRCRAPDKCRCLISSKQIGGEQ